MIKKLLSLFSPYRFIYLEMIDGKCVHAQSNIKNMNLVIIHTDKKQEESGYNCWEMSKVAYETEKNVQKRIDEINNTLK